MLFLTNVIYSLYVPAFSYFTGSLIYMLNVVGEFLALTVQNGQIYKQNDRQLGSTKIITCPHVFVDGKNR